MSRDITSILKNKITKPNVEKSKLKIDYVTRKLDSQINKNFDKQWVIKGTYLIKNVPKMEGASGQVKIAGFDLDGTLINTKSGSKFATNANDWKWFNTNVVSQLKKYSHDHLLVIFTNQGGVIANQDSKSYIKFKSRIDSIAKELSKDIDLQKLFIYASPKKPAKEQSTHDFHSKMRKPSIGMWKELESDLTKLDQSIDLKSSFFVGDAAGRANDFSNSDLQFSKSIGIDFKIPEELFTE